MSILDRQYSALKNGNNTQYVQPNQSLEDDTSLTIAKNIEWPHG